MEPILIRHGEPLKIVDADGPAFEPRYTSIHRVLASRRGDRTLQALNETAHLRGTNLLA